MGVVGAIGIGGTNFHSAIGTPHGGLESEIHTERTSARDLDRQIASAIDRLQRQSEEGLQAIAVASKGLVDRAAGRIELMDISGGPTLEEYPLADVIRERTDVPIYLENDCIAGALAEYHFGAGIDEECVVHVTMGTGIGAGVIDRGHVLRGASNFAGEVGGIRVGPQDGLEWCGIPGAWEAYCSGPGIAEYAAEYIEAVDATPELRRALDAEDPTPEIFHAAASGDEVARDLLDHVARMNAQAVGAIANLFDPALITLGGGVATNHPELTLQGIHRYLPASLIAEPPRIEVTEITYMGIVGAFAQVAHAERERPRETPPLAISD